MTSCAAYLGLMEPLYRPVLACGDDRLVAFSWDSDFRLENLAQWAQARTLLPPQEAALVDLLQRLIRQGRLGEASLLSAEALVLCPDSVALLQLKARLERLLGRVPSARALLEDLLTRYPDCSAARAELIEILLATNCLPEAEGHLLDAAQADQAELWESLRRRLQMAHWVHDQGHQLTPVEGTEAILERAQMMLEFGLSAQALELLERVSSPARSLVWDLQWLQALCGSGQHGPALAWIRHLLGIQPQTFDVLHALGMAASGLGEHNLAVECFQAVVDLRPDHALAWFNLCRAKFNLGAINPAFDALLRSLALNPFSHHAHTTLAVLYGLEGETDGIAQALQRALWLHPGDAEAYSMLGMLAIMQKRLDKAEMLSSKAIRLEPADYQAHANLAITLLLQGRYSEAWPYYCWRFQAPSFRLEVPPGVPLWDGQFDVDEVLLVAEQGIGDLLQFMRYGGFLALSVPKVSILVPRSLKSLVERSGIFAAVYHFQDSLQLAGRSAWLPLLSLPELLQISPDNILWNSAYLEPCANAVARWHERIRGKVAPRERVVALNWQGNPQIERHQMAGRSLPLEALAPLAELSNVQLLAVQKGFGTEQLERCSFADRFVACQPEIDATWDFLETAAILACCDVVITSDTAVAHLAGALGLPTWLLLHHVPDWRWGLEGSTTPWYGSMRLFRQEVPGDWDGVVAAVCRALIADRPDLLASS